jgi:hypothetical protein
VGSEEPITGFPERPSDATGQQMNKYFNISNEFYEYIAYQYGLKLVVNTSF